MIFSISILFIHPRGSSVKPQVQIQQTEIKYLGKHVKQQQSTSQKFSSSEAWKHESVVDHKLLLSDFGSTAQLHAQSPPRRCRCQDEAQAGVGWTADTPSSGVTGHSAPESQWRPGTAFTDALWSSESRQVLDPLPCAPTGDEWSSVTFQHSQSG